MRRTPQPTQTQSTTSFSSSCKKTQANLFNRSLHTRVSSLPGWMPTVSGLRRTVTSSKRKATQSSLDWRPINPFTPENINDEAIVVFKDKRIRDLVIASSVNLSGCIEASWRPTVHTKYKMICTVGRVGKISSKFVVFTLYIPPSSRAGEHKTLMSALTEEISAVKADINDPVIIVAGDLNHRAQSAMWTPSSLCSLPRLGAPTPLILYTPTWGRASRKAGSRHLTKLNLGHSATTNVFMSRLYHDN